MTCAASPNHRVVVVAATVIGARAVPGDSTEPSPLSPKLLPAATTTTTPAREAASTAFESASAEGSIWTPPSDRSITSMPSATAASTARARSAVLPTAP